MTGASPRPVSRSNSRYMLPRFNSKRSSKISEYDEETQEKSGIEPYTATLKPFIDTTSADAMIAGGVDILNTNLANVIESALGTPMPAFEVRFKDLSITAKVQVTASGKVEVPNLWTHFRDRVTGCMQKKNIVEKNILRGISGVFKPGRITLVLGQPGSGKSSLMKILSGRFPMDKNIDYSGSIHYNQHDRNDVLPLLPRYVGYANQIDDHYPRMTVLETFQFAHQCTSGEGHEPWAVEALSHNSPEQNERTMEILNAHHKYAPELAVKKLGLDRCKDTIVGNAMLRGVSGGERKRVTTGEMIFGNKLISLMDEISTGLDSAATYDIVNGMKSVAKNFRKNIIISLLQPPPEVYDLFDDILVLNDGYIMFHGPREEVLPYFESLGFHCPPRRDVADFLLDLGTAKQTVYQTVTGMGRSAPYNAPEFAKRFKESSIYQETLAYLNSPYYQHESSILRGNGKSKPFRQTLVEDVQVLLKRQVLLTIRNTAFVRGRAFMVILMGLLYGITFFQFDDTNAQIVMGLLFSTTMFLSMGQSSQVPTIMDARSVFYKQRGSNFFRSPAYVISSSLAQLPFALMETILFGTVVYWMGGFVGSAEAFILFLITLFFCQMCFGSVFYLIASISPSLTIAQPLMMVAILFFVLFGGFLITYDNIQDYFIWIYWINPIAWGVRALGINQYTDKKFDVCAVGSIDYCKLFGKTLGEYNLSLFNLPSEQEWVYYSWAYFLSTYFVLLTLSAFVLEYKRYESPENTTITQEDTDPEILERTLSQRNDSYIQHPDTPKLLCDQETLLQVRALPGAEKNISGFVPVSLAFVDLWYSVPMPGNKDEEIDLLKGVSGFALPGTITALMGSSGAGKTTLMDVIAGRKTGGRIRGQILLNGYPSNDLAIRRCTGYCEQMDIHSDSATVKEALLFSAFLRQDSAVSDEDKYASVQECMELLELDSIANKVIRGSSTEQMKRITIGVELAAQPSILFMDEPTSGLDARSAKLIMDGVRKIANSGRTVICTIHQPSSEVFSVFDSLLLLKRGGQTVFFGELGEDSKNLINYFASAPGVEKIKPGYNPATWMLECIGAGVGNEHKLDFAEYFNESDQKKLLEEDLDQDGVARPSPSLPEMKFSKKRASGALIQFNLLCKRFFRLYWRTPTYNATRLMLSVVLSLVFGVIYEGTDYATFSGANAGVGMIFVSTLFMGIISFSSVLPVAAAERTAFYRERACQTYNALWYFIAGTLAEIPYVFVASLLFVSILYPMVGFTGGNSFFIYWTILSLHVLMQVYLGQFMVYFLPSVEVASIFGALLNSIFMLFAGFNPPTSQIPSAFKWIHYISPPSYSIAALTAVVLSDCPEGSTYENSSNYGCQILKEGPPQLGQVTVKQYVEGNFDMKYDVIGRNIGVIIALIVAFRVLALISLRYVNHLKR